MEGVCFNNKEPKRCADLSLSDLTYDRESSKYVPMVCQIPNKASEGQSRENTKFCSCPARSKLS